MPGKLLTAFPAHVCILCLAYLIKCHFLGLAYGTFVGRLGPFNGIAAYLADPVIGLFVLPEIIEGLLVQARMHFFNIVRILEGPDRAVNCPPLSPRRSLPGTWI